MPQVPNDAEANEVVLPAKRGRKSNASKGLEKADIILDVLVTPSQRDALEDAIPLYFSSIQKDPRLIEMVQTGDLTWGQMGNRGANG